MFLYCKTKKDADASFFGADNEIRTHDLVITNDVLCQLSYISTRNVNNYIKVT